MTRRTLLWRCGAAALAVGLPVLGHVARRGGPARCAYDGETIEPSYRVRIVDASGSRPFCCVGCAGRWLERSGERPECVYVTDEISGAELPADEATFVRSLVYTRRSTGDRIHVFRRPEDADRHVREARGRVLAGPARPL